jgi:16S rRNA G1207 methylase RsmC
MLNKAVVSQAKTKEMTGRLKPQAAEKAAQACTQWIQRTSKEAEQALLQLLRSCTEPAQLAAVEASLRKAIDSWQHATEDQAPPTGVQQPPVNVPALYAEEEASQE